MAGDCCRSTTTDTRIKKRTFVMMWYDTNYECERAGYYESEEKLIAAYDDLKSWPNIRHNSIVAYEVLSPVKFKTSII